MSLYSLGLQLNWLTEPYFILGLYFRLLWRKLKVPEHFGASACALYFILQLILS
ncbi:hypothetical protein [Pontibacter flavimaris]|uniref:hypothetical protein n=1 Tax=Pontibacter flavimaris TaxID=1797110 RepID=UPI00147C0A02|nr:hypothetical protein [Pontibacter flavimaris]